MAIALASVTVLTGTALPDAAIDPSVFTLYTEIDPWVPPGPFRTYNAFLEGASTDATGEVPVAIAFVVVVNVPWLRSIVNSETCEFPCEAMYKKPVVAEDPLLIEQPNKNASP